MKNIHEILKGFGLEIPEGKKSEFETALKENYITVGEADKIKTARDNFKSQLETAATQLKAFEGVDVAELQGVFQALGKGAASLLISVLRQFALVLPVAWGMSQWIGSDLSNAWLVWLTFPFAEVMTAIVAIVVLGRIRRTYGRL